MNLPYPYEAAIRVTRFSLHDMTNNKACSQEPSEAPISVEDQCLYGLYFYTRHVDIELLASAPIELDAYGNPNGFVYLIRALRLADPSSPWTEPILRYRELERQHYGL